MENTLINLITKSVIQEINKYNEELISKDMRIKVGVSARHVHLSREDLYILFGNEYNLTIKKTLMGDQFAAEETVTILGDKLKSIEKVRILGPIRGETQVEISATDAISLGVKAPIRLSGEIKESAPITIVGPKGVVRKEYGCIIAKRHIHMHPDDSKILGIKEGLVSVKFGGQRAGVLENVDVRIREDFHLEMHIDTDEANALSIKNNDLVEILV